MKATNVALLFPLIALLISPIDLCHAQGTTFDIRNCTPGICGTYPSPSADFAAAINAAQLFFGSATIIDARQPGAFSTTGTACPPFTVATVVCVFSKSDISANLPFTFVSNILWGEYLIVTSVPWTTPSLPPQWIGMTSGGDTTSRIVGTTLVACYIPQTVAATCGPGAFPQIPITPIRAVGGPFIDSAPYSVGTVSCDTASNSVCTGVGTTFTSSMVGGYLTSCATSVNHSATCPNGQNANSNLILAFGSSTSLTLAGTFGGPTGAAITYAIYRPSIIPLLAWGGNVASLAYKNNSFGGILQDFFIDLEGLPLGVGLYSNTAQELDVFRRIHVTLNANLENNSVPTGSLMACGMFDRSFQDHNDAGPAHFTMEGANCSVGPGFVATSTSFLPYGWVFEGRSVIRGNTGDGNNGTFDIGTVTGKNTSNVTIFQDCAYVDGVYRLHVKGNHCENSVDGVDVGPVNPTFGVVVEDFSSANFGTSPFNLVTFGTNVSASQIRNESTLVNSGNLIADSSAGGMTLTSGSSCLTSFSAACILGDYQQSLSYFVGGLAASTPPNSSVTPLSISEGATSTTFPTAALSIFQASNTGTTNVPALNIASTWNNSSLAGPLFKIALTNTASIANSPLLSLSAGSSGTSSEFSVDTGWKRAEQRVLQGYQHHRE
jgi:hypothetical protein